MPSLNVRASRKSGQQRHRALPNLVLGVAALLILLALPEVRGLGGLVKIAYVHAALFFGGLILIAGGLVLGVIASIAEVRGRRSSHLGDDRAPAPPNQSTPRSTPQASSYLAKSAARADAAYAVGMASLFLTLLAGGILTKVAWGDFLWSEPRYAYLEIIIAAGAIILAAKYLLGVPRPFLLAGQAAQVVYAVYKLFTVESIFHPENPIYGGDAAVWVGYSIFFLLVTLLLVRLAVALAKKWSSTIG